MARDDLKEVLVTEVVTTLRVWRVRACDVSDAVNRISDRKGAPPSTRPKRVTSRTMTRWTGAVAGE
jgi:hypothetical protein